MSRDFRVCKKLRIGRITTYIFRFVGFAACQSSAVATNSNMLLTDYSIMYIEYMCFASVANSRHKKTNRHDKGKVRVGVNYSANGVSGVPKVNGSITMFAICRSGDKTESGTIDGSSSHPPIIT